ncbi:MAG: hypothetical protein Fur005_35180 [Roseiflexaceae bacterium]
MRPGFVFGIVVIGTALAIWAGFPDWIGLIVVVAGLCGYDLWLLRQRIAQLPAAEQRAIRQPHQRRLAITAGIGLLLGSLALVARIRPGFAMLVILAIMAMVVLTITLRRIRIF